MHPFRVLCFDGGGIKGLFTARLVQRLAEARPGLLGATHLLAGTSSGGLIALGLAAGKPPEDLVALYLNQAQRIFDDSFWDDLRDLGNAVGADYDSRKFKRLLHREFGRRRLQDLHKRVLVPCFALDAPATRKRPRSWKPKFFHNFPGRDSDGSARVVDVALATSAAPAYFPSYRGYIDGGVVANNPSLAALAQALDPRAAGRPLDEIQLLSLGAGLEPKYIAGSRVDWGWGQWARPLVSLMISGVMGVADFQCEQILGERYHRVDAVFDRPVNLDDTTPGTLEYLVGQAGAVGLDDTLAWLEKMGWS